jgi:hypothetical protein
LFDQLDIGPVSSVACRAPLLKPSRVSLLGTDCCCLLQNTGKEIVFFANRTSRTSQIARTDDKSGEIQSENQQLQSFIRLMSASMIPQISRHMLKWRSKSGRASNQKVQRYLLDEIIFAIK